MPFGLDIKSVIAGILLAYFVIPWVQGMLMRAKAQPTSAQ
jgi:antibiotic biosynthesis monooxygenase (ABM) superfamily enzyme